MATITRTRNGVTTTEEVGETIGEFKAKKKKEVSSAAVTRFKKSVAEAESEGKLIKRSADVSLEGDVLKMTTELPSGDILVETTSKRKRTARPIPVQEFKRPEIIETPISKEKKPVKRPTDTISKGEPSGIVARKIGELTSSFGEGFSLQPTAEKRVRAGTGFEAVGFTLGSTAAVGSAGLSKLLGKLAKPIPFVSELALGIESFFSKKPVQVGLGGLAAVSVGTTTVTEGSEAAVRQTANLGRDIAAFGGIIKGAKPSGIKGDFFVNTFQDTTVIRGSGVIEGRPFTEVTTTTDLGKTSSTQINIGDRILLIDRTPKLTKVKVLESKTLKPIDSFQTDPSVKSISSRISDIQKQPLERVAEIETGFFAKSLTRQTQTAKVEGFGIGPIGENIKLDLALKKISETTVIASKPLRSIDELVKEADIAKGTVGIVKKPRLREVGGVKFVEEDVGLQKDLVSLRKSDFGLIVEKVASARPITSEQFFQVGKGKIEIRTSEPLNIFKSKKGELLPSRTVPEQTFVQQVGIPKPKSKFRALEFTPSFDVAIKQPFTFVTLPSKPFVESPSIISTPITSVFPDIKTGPKFIPISKSIPLQIIKPVQKAGVISKAKPAPSQEPIQFIESIQEFKSVQIIEPIVARKSFERAPPIRPVIPRSVLTELPIRPSVPKIPLFGGVSQPLFDVEVGGIGKKFFFQDQDLTLREAISFGRTKVKGTAAASLRITAKDGGDRSFLDLVQSRLGGEFRRSKIDEDVFVQKREFRIGTRGEKEDITLLGLQALKSKDLKSLF